MKLCIDCKWLEVNENFIEYSECTNPKVFIKSPVTGVQFSGRAYLARNDSFNEYEKLEQDFTRKLSSEVKFGKDAKYFEEKEKDK